MKKTPKPKYISRFKNRLFKQSMKNPNAIIVDNKEIVLDPTLPLERRANP